MAPLLFQNPLDHSHLSALWGLIGRGPDPGLTGRRTFHGTNVILRMYSAGMHLQVYLRLGAWPGSMVLSSCSSLYERVSVTNTSYGPSGGKVSHCHNIVRGRR